MLGTNSTAIGQQGTIVGAGINATNSGAGGGVVLGTNNIAVGQPGSTAIGQQGTIVGAGVGSNTAPGVVVATPNASGGVVFRTNWWPAIPLSGVGGSLGQQGTIVGFGVVMPDVACTMHGPDVDLDVVVDATTIGEGMRRDG